MPINLKNIIQILHAKWFGGNSDINIDHLSIDSRSLQNGPKTLFFALSGPNNNAHDYIPDLIEKGVQERMPKFMEWYGAMGLMITLVWLYVEFLRLLSKLNSKN